MIPKRIHYCWVGGNPKPDPVKKCIKSWKKYCPDYEIIEWNEEKYDFTKVDYMRQAYDAKKWGFVPDYARLDIIYQYGGIYLDTDVELVRSLDPLLSNVGYAGVEFNTDQYCYVNLGSGFGSEAGNSVIKMLRDDYDGRNFVLADGTLDLTPSPHLTTDVLIKLGYKPEDRKQMLEGITIYPSDYFCPRDWKTGLMHKTQNTYSIHHYDASWYSEEEQKKKAIIWEKAHQDYIKHTPNRILKRLLGEQKYSRLKKRIRS